MSKRIDFTMLTIVNESQEVDVPAWVVDLASFRRWVDSDDFPEHGRICFLKGKVWVDVSREQLFSHLKVKDQYTKRLDALTEDEELGLYFSDGLLLTNVDVDISVIPDGTFFSKESLESGRVRLIEGAEEGFVEVEGSPDMTLEIVSRSSVRKDTVVLFRAYWEAGVKEYWLVDARQSPPRFDIFKHGAKGYVPVKKQNGWIKSAVFGKSFRLVEKKYPTGHAQYSLEIR